MTDICTEFLWKNYWEIGNVEGRVKIGRITFKWILGNGKSVQCHCYRIHDQGLIPNKSGTFMSLLPCPDQY
jgi:hypothetical protein